MTYPTGVEEAITEVLGGNRDAYRRLLETYALPLRCYLASQVYHMDDVDDLAQEVFITAYRKLATFILGNDFAAWLRGIAHNEVLMYHRSRSTQQSALSRFQEEVAQITKDKLNNLVSNDRAELIERLLFCIAQLPDRLRHVVRAGLNGETVAKLSEEMQTTANAIYTMHYRANRLLRNCLERSSA